MRGSAMMLIRFAIAAAAFCAMLLGAHSVNAATISNLGGVVLVSKGDGFSPIASNAELAPGSQIMVRPGGLASITYGNNCVVRVGPGVWLVQDAPPCAHGATMIDFTGRMNQQTSPPSPEVDPLLVGGVLVAAGVALAIIASQSNSDKPASP